MKTMTITTTTAVGFLALLHFVMGSKLDEHRYTVSEVAAFDEATWKKKFEAFMTRYGKEYASENEYNKRLEAYKVHKNVYTTTDIIFVPCACANR